MSRGDVVEKTIEHANMVKYQWPMQNFFILGCSAVIGCIGGAVGFCIAFPLVAYTYMRERQECKIAISTILLASLSSGFLITYFYAVGFTLFFLGIHVLRLLNKNIYEWITYACAFIMIPYGLYFYGFSITVAWMVLFVYMIMQGLQAEYHWLSKKLVFVSTIYGCILFAFALFAKAFVPLTMQPYVFLIVLFLITYICDQKTLLMFVLFGSLFTTQAMPELPWLTLLAVLSFWKQQKLLAFVSILLCGIYLQASVQEVILLSLFTLFAFAYQEAYVPFMPIVPTYDPDVLTSQSILKRQIQNFSNIFQSLSQYYENVSDVQAQLLANMALALKCSADEVKKLEMSESLKEKILRALQGYQYDVVGFEMSHRKEGCITMEFDIRNIQKREIKQTLLPLLEVLTHEHLELSEVQHYRFTNGYHHIVFENSVPFKIDAYADSLKNMFESSGDCFSIFRFRNTVISMISDGMGNGEKAASAARLITNVFQRMVVSGIPQRESIKCINKLLQSDAYATLDVICFDCSEGKAYIFKSAACPTFLMRDQQVYEISGSSLPVGIISSIEPDCFVADMEVGDEYLMVSDGIYLDEIYAWMKQKPKDSSKASLEVLMRILKEKQRVDDSTALLSKIEKNGKTG